MGRAACALVFHSSIAKGAARRLSLGGSRRHSGAACTAQHHHCPDVRHRVLHFAAQGGAPSYNLSRRSIAQQLSGRAHTAHADTLCHCLCPTMRAYLHCDIHFKQGDCWRRFDSFFQYSCCSTLRRLPGWRGCIRTAAKDGGNGWRGGLLWRCSLPAPPPASAWPPCRRRITPAVTRCTGSIPS